MQEERGSFPVITEVKHVSEDEVQITRKHIYRSKNFGHVKFPKEAQEIIRIDRRLVNRRPQDVVLESYSDSGFK